MSHLLPFHFWHLSINMPIKISSHLYALITWQACPVSSPPQNQSEEGSKPASSPIHVLSRCCMTLWATPHFASLLVSEYLYVCVCVFVWACICVSIAEGLAVYPCKCAWVWACVCVYLGLEWFCIFAVSTLFLQPASPRRWSMWRMSCEQLVFSGEQTGFFGSPWQHKNVWRNKANTALSLNNCML